MVQLKLSPAQAAIVAWWREGPAAATKEPEEAAGTIPGLANLGNTCFMNAVLQCLLNTPAWLAEACRTFTSLELGDSQLSGKAVLGRGFAQLVAEYNSKDGKPLSRSNAALKNLKAAIATLDPQYAGCQQQDAYEFLGCLLEGLEENFRMLFHREGALDRPSPAAAVIRAVCGVTAHTSRTCHACSQCFRVDEVTDTALRVPLISPGAQLDCAAREEEERLPTSLAELLEAARRPERLEGYDCDACRERAAEAGTGDARPEGSGATQHAGIITGTRDVLVVVLYRFCHALDSAGCARPMKVRRQVACPSVLNMETGEYHLFGVVSHIGTSLSGGHYIAAVKSLRDGLWYECDDERVRPLNLMALYDSRSVSAVRDGADPYILFYHLKKGVPVPELRAAAGDPPAVAGGACGCTTSVEAGHQGSLNEDQPDAAEGTCACSASSKAGHEGSRDEDTSRDVAQPEGPCQEDTPLQAEGGTCHEEQRQCDADELRAVPAPGAEVSASGAEDAASGSAVPAHPGDRIQDSTEESLADWVIVEPGDKEGFSEHLVCEGGGAASPTTVQSGTVTEQHPAAEGEKGSCAQESPGEREEPAAAPDGADAEHAVRPSPITTGADLGDTGRGAAGQVEAHSQHRKRLVRGRPSVLGLLCMGVVELGRAVLQHSAMVVQARVRRRILPGSPLSALAGCCLERAGGAR